jgi:hypothetical protein
MGSILGSIAPVTGRNDAQRRPRIRLNEAETGRPVTCRYAASPVLQAGGHWFEPSTAHDDLPALVRRRPDDVAAPRAVAPEGGPMHEDPTLRVQVPAELLEQIAARAAELVLARLARALPMPDCGRGG